MRRRLLLVGLLLLVGSGLVGFPAQTMASEMQEKEKFAPVTLKAHLLTHFIARSKWPREALPPDGSRPLVVGIVGDNPFSAGHQKLIRKARAPGSKARVVIKEIDDAEGARSAHLLFFAKNSDAKTRRKVLAAVDGRPVLTLGTDHSVGAMFDVLFVQGKIRFTTTTSLFKKCGIAVSSKLMILNHARPD